MKGSGHWRVPRDATDTALGIIAGLMIYGGTVVVLMLLAQPIVRVVVAWLKAEGGR